MQHPKRKGSPVVNFLAKKEPSPNGYDKLIPFSSFFQKKDVHLQPKIHFQTN